MKENDNEDESSSSNNSLLNVLKKNDDENSDNILIRKTSTTSETETTFDKQIIKKVEKEEKELRIQMKLKEKKKFLKKLTTASRKDYLVFFFLLISSSFNYNYFFLPFIAISMLYLLCIENLNYRALRLKYFLEIFSLGYASYLLLYKIIVYLLIKNKDQMVLTEKISLFIDLGCCILKNLNSNTYFIMNFAPEIIIIAASGYGLLTSFKCRLLKESDLDIKNISHLKLSKYILIIYLLIVLLTMFNLSYLSLFYVVCIQFVIFLSSVQFSERITKKLFKIFLYLLILLISFQIILTNYLNIPSVQKKYLKEYSERNDDHIKSYFTWVQIGINIDDSEQTKEVLIKFGGYLFSIINLIVLINTINKLNLEKKLGSDNSQDDNKIVINKKYGIFTKIMNKIMKILYHPVFNFESSRILSIIWTYFYCNIFSLGILIFIFISFFSAHTKRNKFLVIYILTPMLFLSLCSAHISNIKGIFEGLSEMEIMKYSRYGFEKYDEDYIFLEYLVGHLFFIIVMFLINSIYTAELFPRDILPKRKVEKPQKIEMQIMNSINKLDESILPKDKRNDSKLSVHDINLDNLVISKRRYIVKDKRPTDINEELKKNVFDGKVTFLRLLTKIILTYLDKITLIVMYFVSVYTVNLMHVILVSILIFQIISPGKLNYCYKINALIFQSLYLIEFIINLLKIKYFDAFNKYKNLLKFLIVYNENIYSNDIEIFIYGVIYCFYFQYRTCNIDSIKRLLNNKKISLEEYIKIKLEDYPRFQIFLFGLGNILLHIYLWILFGAFLFFNSYFEINFLFGIKLFLFLICSYQFIILIQSVSKEYSNFQCIKTFNRIFLIFTSSNTLAVYLYQFLCKDFLPIKEKIKSKKTFFFENLPNFGFTIYQDENLYYNFLPHFLSTFIAIVFVSRTEETLNLMVKYSYQRKTTLGNFHAEKIRKKIEERERMNKIKNEPNEFIQDKLYADKYEENYNEIMIYLFLCFYMFLFSVSIL